MKTDIISVSSSGRQMETALAQVEKVAAYKELGHKQALHLRLLAEEMMGMMRSITGEQEGEFWIEDEDGVYRLHLKVVTPMDSDKREKLLSVSSTGKNESARGLMGRLRDFFDQSMDSDVASVTSPLLAPDMFEQTGMTSLEKEWSLIRYVGALSDKVKEDDPAAKEAWDELEKSVVARVADDVKVSIKGRTVEMTIIKKMN
ncbi:MAG: hypothetical protein IKI24_08420 [Clostridia bacterium]|nr:hypothetical protein [Clostridia bacterium]MCR4577915.1 hypothetical protein [Clostridiales bacterium]